MAKKEFDMASMRKSAVPVPSTAIKMKSPEEIRERNLQVKTETLIESIEDFSSLPPANTLAGVVEEIQAWVAVTKKAIYEAGKRFLRIRDEKLYEEAGFSNFGDWAEASGTGLSSTMAYKYASIVEVYGERVKDREDLSVSNLTESLRIARENPDYVDEIFELVQNSTVKKIRELSKDFTPEKLKTSSSVIVNRRDIPKLSESETSMIKLESAFQRAMRFNSDNEELKQAYYRLFGGK